VAEDGLFSLQSSVLLVYLWCPDCYVLSRHVFLCFYLLCISFLWVLYLPFLYVVFF
jgi:hypothetical protein